jgi:hypothetical protein
MKKNFGLNQILKKCIPHVVSLALIYLFTIIYFYPVFFEDKGLPQGDQISAIGASKEVKDYEKETGQYSEWTNSMFSGMPTTALYSLP